MRNFRTEREKSEANIKSGSIVYGNVSNAVTLYGEEKFHASKGHGFAAERVNSLHDRLSGHNVKLEGDDNSKNGADRVVDGVNIQSKYCKTGSKCISECFDENGWRYWDVDASGERSPMQIEVPYDKYDDAIQSMKAHIEKGEIEGVSDPEEANNIVRRGKFTYKQAQNIAKAGTVESITYDAVNGTIIATNSFGITSLLTFATSVWNGCSIDVALGNAVAEGLKVGGVTFVSAILAGQLSKAGLNSLLVGSSEAVIKVLGPKGSAVLVNAFSKGTNIYGAAAMKSAAKLLRGNVITGIASIVVLSTEDVVDIFRGRISGGQLLKNVVGTTSSVAGGTAGWIGGATVGASIGSVVPVIGTAVGGVVGGLAGAIGGGTIMKNASDAVLDNFIEDDADYMVCILEEVFTDVAQEYLLSKQEIEGITESISKSVNGNDLKVMYASDDRKRYARNLIMPFVDYEIKNRQYIKKPSLEEMQKSLRWVLEEVADSEEYQAEFT